MKPMISGTENVYALYASLVMVVLLSIMTYFHRSNLLKYLYIADIFCLITYVITSLILDKQPVGVPASSSFMKALPIICVLSGFAGFFLFITAVPAFIKEMATHNLLGKVIMGIGIALYVLFDVYCFFYTLIPQHKFL